MNKTFATNCTNYADPALLGKPRMGQRCAPAHARGLKRIVSCNSWRFSEYAVSSPECPLTNELIDNTHVHLAQGIMGGYSHPVLQSPNLSKEIGS
jgi:hypothetical protein